jgi:hypothetical protein
MSAKWGHQVLNGGMLMVKDSWWYQQLFAINNPYFIYVVDFNLFKWYSPCLQKGHQVLNGGTLMDKDSWWYQKLFAINNSYFN